MQKWLDLRKESERRVWRRRRFAKHIVKQQMASLFARNLHLQFPKKKIHVGFGSGGFSSTYKKHAPVGKKGFQERLHSSLKSFGSSLSTVDEFRTSKLSCCCHAETTSVSVEESHNTGSAANRLLKCKKCHKVFNRDISAAFNIAMLARKKLLKEKRPSCFLKADIIHLN